LGSISTKKIDGKGIIHMSTAVSESPFRGDPGATKATVDALPSPCESADIAVCYSSGSIDAKVVAFQI
jgi:hypothetical protein